MHLSLNSVGGFIVLIFTGGQGYEGCGVEIAGPQGVGTGRTEFSLHEIAPGSAKPST